MPRLLVLDDEPEICQMVEHAASVLGFETASATDPAQISPEQLASIDVLVLDLMMPGIDGIEVMRGLSELGHKPQIMLISGLDARVLEGARHMARAQGLEVVSTLRKPFRPRELQEIFKSVFAHLHDHKSNAPHAAGAAHSFSVQDIDAAIERNEFLVYLQPQVALSNLDWVGIEALVRWQHPEHGLLSPAAFIAVAEGRELALKFTEHVIRIAVEHFKRLSHECGYRGSLSVNMPPTALTDVRFPERLLPLLSEYEVPPAAFKLEMTENSLPESDQVLFDITTRLTMRGVRISIDDFGTGNSGLERLHDAPFDELKIDMVFIRNADEQTTPTSRAIIESAVQLGHRLKMTVVAEGVETASSMQWLKSVGCDIVQGYHIARPMPIDELIQWSEQWRAKVSSHASALAPTDK
jgi:EAL domain-containing protein (putative c-di-GMP-specific phosphodiesterase class I)/FixJ family two-component response regulator